jgi:hypothetical protein
MTVVERPLCHLRFHTRNELEWHGRTDHCHHHDRDADNTADRSAEQETVERTLVSQPAG